MAVAEGPPTQVQDPPASALALSRAGVTLVVLGLQSVDPLMSRDADPMRLRGVEFEMERPPRSSELRWFPEGVPRAMVPPEEQCDRSEAYRPAGINCVQLNRENRSLYGS